MQLRDFVAETIKEVIEGVVAAQAYAKEKGAVVNPKLNFHNYNQDLLLDSATGRPTRSISFDVAVTAAEGTKTQGGIAVFTGVLGLGSKGQSEKSNETVNRIQFSVPVSLPIGEHRDETHSPLRSSAAQRQTRL
jgi:hypothetical protein